MTRKSIPDPIKARVAAIVEQFNREVGQQHAAMYLPRYRGNYLYLDRADFTGDRGQICRLTYTGDENSWDFAIYRYSTNRYEPDEWLFPGFEHVDGTVKGAMMAGLEAYPP